MKSVKGTETEKNLLKAFAGESQARNRYTYFSSAARKEGLVQISDIFSETADQEKEHAKRFFSFLEGGEVEIRLEYRNPIGVEVGYFVTFATVIVLIAYPKFGHILKRFKLRFFDFSLDNEQVDY